MEYTLRLADEGPQLWGRELARAMRARLVAMLEQLQLGDILVLDTEGVDVFDFSFANELFGKTALTLADEYSGRFVVVEHLTPYARENLTKALESLGVAMIERVGKQLLLIGKVHPADQETFDAIIGARGPVTAAALKEQLDVTLTAMNERLSKLTSFALVRRERGRSPAGRELYQYHAPG